MKRAALLSLLAVTALYAVLFLAVGGVLPPLAAAVLVPAMFLGAIAAAFQMARAVAPATLFGPLRRRAGFLVVIAATLTTLPTLGSFGLLDPWETHYAEVAREILARRDPVSTWWSHEGWFMSKPILAFWLQAIAMAALGVRSAPGRVLEGIAGHVARPEWAIRLPGALLAILGASLLYAGVARAYGRRAALFGSVILVTTPQWLLLARQSITDMPLVACLSASMGLFLRGVHAAPEACLGVHEVRLGGRVLRLTGSHLVGLAIAAVVVPQIIYLALANVELVWEARAHGLRLREDSFWSGSPGNCGLPGIPACVQQSPVHPRLAPALQATVWALLFGVVLTGCCGERRTRRALFLGAWFFAGLATMAKGPLGLALPAAVAAVYIVATGRLRLVADLRVPTGLAIAVLMVCPWYLALYARHGRLFIDELVLRHMLGRALEHLHDTNAGDDTSFRYYVGQLGYGAFPWIGLLPMACVGFASSRSLPRHAEIILAAWFFVAFGLFCGMLTKFHHYIFPAVPPIAVFLGVGLDRALRLQAPPDRIRKAGAGMVGAMAIAMIGRDLVVTGDVVGQARLLHLFTYQYHRSWPVAVDLRAAVLAFGALAAAPLVLLRRRAIHATSAVAVLFALWVANVYLLRIAPHWGQRGLIEAYYRSRASDTEPLVAYQMNWKGEIFYTGGRAAVFVSGGAGVPAYVRRSATGGAKAVFFVTEPSHLKDLRADLASVSTSIETLTTPADNDKFCLVRATLL